MSAEVELEPTVARVFSENIDHFDQSSDLYWMAKMSFLLASITELGVEKAQVLLAQNAKKRGLPALQPFPPSQIKELVTYAEKEAEQNFPLLNAQFAVATWAGLEALIEDVLVALIVDRPEVLRCETFEKIKISLSTYENLDSEDRARYVLREVSLRDAAKLRNGVAGFEALLEYFSLSGTVEDETRRILFEFSQVRNVLVHRLHLVDSRFLLACPQLGYKRGDRVLVKDDQLQRYVKAVMNYTKELARRMAEKWPRKKRGVVPPPQPTTPAPQAPRPPRNAADDASKEE